MRNSARIRVVLAVALPDPLTVLKVMQKSLIIDFEFAIVLVSMTGMIRAIQRIAGTLISRKAINSICSINAW